MITLLDTRPDKDLCDLCGSPVAVKFAFRNEEYEIFMYECPQCNKKFCFMMTHKPS